MIKTPLDIFLESVKAKDYAKAHDIYYDDKVKIRKQSSQTVSFAIDGLVSFNTMDTPVCGIKLLEGFMIWSQRMIPEVMDYISWEFNSWKRTEMTNSYPFATLITSMPDIYSYFGRLCYLYRMGFVPISRTRSLHANPKWGNKHYYVIQMAREFPELLNYTSNKSSLVPINFPPILDLLNEKISHEEYERLRFA